MYCWGVSEDMFDACWFLLAAYCLLLFCCWSLDTLLLVPLVTLVTGTRIRIQKFCFWG